MLMQPSLPPAGTAHSAEQRTVSFFFLLFFDVKICFETRAIFGSGENAKIDQNRRLGRKWGHQGQQFFDFSDFLTISRFFVKI